MVNAKKKYTETESNVANPTKKHFIQTLEIKEDTNMMRIYSVVCPSDFFSLAKIKSTTL